MNPANETDLGREVRAAVAKALARFKDNDIAALKVSDLRKIDQLINPEPEGFEIDTRRDRPVHAELSLKRLERMRAEDAAAAGAQS